MNYYQSDSERSNLVLLQNSLEMELISNQCFVFKSFFFFFFLPLHVFWFCLLFHISLGFVLDLCVNAFVAVFAVLQCDSWC